MPLDDAPRPGGAPVVAITREQSAGVGFGGGEHAVGVGRVDGDRAFALVGGAAADVDVRAEGDGREIRRGRGSRRGDAQQHARVEHLDRRQRGDVAG